MQIASEKVVFVFDLIKLFEDVPDVMDNCLARILQSPRVLKLGMRCLLVCRCSLPFQHIMHIVNIKNMFYSCQKEIHFVSVL